MILGFAYEVCTHVSLHMSTNFIGKCTKCLNQQECVRLLIELAVHQSEKFNHCLVSLTYSPYPFSLFGILFSIYVPRETTQGDMVMPGVRLRFLLIFF